jgi:dephospho-CoA kinase
VLRVGLTGGIASGKSEVSARLAEHGAVVIDADMLAREVVKPGTPALAEIVVAFGPAVLDSTGALDRAALGRQVFGDDAARRRLEAIIHPRVRERATEIEALAPRDAVVVHDIPLLVETGQAADFDVVVVVDCAPERQIERLTTRRGLTAPEAQARIAAQAAREDRLAAGDLVVSNNGTLAALRQATDDLWGELSERAAGRGGVERPG